MEVAIWITFSMSVLVFAGGSMSFIITVWLLKKWVDLDREVFLSVMTRHERELHTHKNAIAKLASELERLNNILSGKFDR